LNRSSILRKVGVAVLAGAMMAMPTNASAQGGDPNPQQRAIVLASPGVVFITTAVDVTVKADFLPGGRRTTYETAFPYASGSGFAINPDGTIITAGHVVEPLTSDIQNRAANEAFAQFVRDLGGDAAADSIEQEFAQNPFGRYFFDDNLFENTTLSVGLARSLNQRYNACYQARSCEFNTTVNVEVFTARGIAGQDVSTGESATIVASSSFEETDVAVLKTNVTNQPTVALAEGTTNLQSGDELVALGFGGSTASLPTGQTEPQKSFGQVSNIRSEGDSQIIEVNMDLEGGFSGGPAITNQAQAVGLVSFDIITAEGESPQEFLRTVEDIRALMSSSGVEATRGPVDTAFQEAMELFWGPPGPQGHFSAAIPRFREVLDLYDGHPLAQQYLSEAQSRRGSAQDVPVEEEGGLPLIPIIIGAAVLLVLIVGGLLLASRRKKAAPAPAAGGYAAPPASFGTPPPASTPAGPPQATPQVAPPQAPQPAAPPQAPPAGVGSPRAEGQQRPVGFQPQPPPAGETTVSQQPPSAGEAPPPPGIGTSKFCSNCGLENASDATYCARCGHTLG
jgi:serine protease Do